MSERPFLKVNNLFVVYLILNKSFPIILDANPSFSGVLDAKFDLFGHGLASKALLCCFLGMLAS
jgi:hypothetical protein